MFSWRFVEILRLLFPLHSPHSLILKHTEGCVVWKKIVLAEGPIDCEICMEFKFLHIFALCMSLCAHALYVCVHIYVSSIYTVVDECIFKHIWAMLPVRVCILRALRNSHVKGLMLVLCSFVLVCVTHGHGMCVTKCIPECCVVCDRDPPLVCGV